MTNTNTIPEPTQQDIDSSAPTSTTQPQPAAQSAHQPATQPAQQQSTAQPTTQCDRDSLINRATENAMNTLGTITLPDLLDQSRDLPEHIRGVILSFISTFFIWKTRTARGAKSSKHRSLSPATLSPAYSCVPARSGS